jgi:hypothetical protein
VLVAGLVAAVGVSAPVPKAAAKPEHGEKNSNALITKHHDKLELKASSEWQGWPTTNLFDGKEETSWYSNTPDNTTTGTNNPVITVVFPEDVAIKRVTVLGNRDPQYLTGYFVTEGTIELLDKNDKVVGTHEMKGAGDKFDFDLKLDKFHTVRAVRFTMTKSENGYCGMGEFMVE